MSEMDLKGAQQTPSWEVSQTNVFPMYVNAAIL